jgi:hypothetical protein
MSSSAVPSTGITVYGCGPDEAATFREVAPCFGVVPTITEAAVSEANVELASGNRCISVGHKTLVTNSTLLALSRAGVRYVSTRSIGYNHIDVNYAQGLGICVGNVAYSPDSVADYTLMLMLMAVRNAKSVIRRTDIHDYRLHDVRGKELRDLTVGVVGTGRIGSAVLDRLRGFGCRALACDTHPKTSACYVPLGELLEQSDVVTEAEHQQERQHCGRRLAERFLGVGPAWLERPADARSRGGDDRSVGKESQQHHPQGEQQGTREHEEPGVAEGELEADAQARFSIHRLLPQARCRALCRCGSRRRAPWR